LALSLLDFDIRTTMRMIVLADVVVAFLTFLYRHEEGPKRLLAIFGCGQLTAATGLALISLRGEISQLLSAHLGNILFYIGISLEMFAFSTVNRAPFRGRPLFVALPLLGAIAFVGVDLLPSDPAGAAARFVLVSSLVVGGAYGLGGLSQFGTARPSRLRKTIGAIFILLALFFIGRAHAAATKGMTIFTATPLQSLTFVTMFVASIVCGVGFMLLMKEETDLALRLAATTDGLTGTLNRRAFFTRGAEVLAMAARHELPVAVLMMDVDHFKRINDTHGHAGGDAVLRALADTIRHQIRPHDLFGRLGGEEFALLLLADGPAALQTAERIRASCAGQTVDYGPGIRYTLSIGAKTLTPRDHSDLSSALNASDAALYRAKASGRDRVMCAD
jgi:diguanylate cyclase (GGDEF)-like protein